MRTTFLALRDIPMRRRWLRLSLGLLPALLFLTACANTSYYPVEHGTRTTGKGATLRKINGIDFWSDGQPPRPYKIIGVIHDRRSSLRKGDLLKDVAKVAKKMKGDAVLDYQAFGAVSGGATAGAGALAGNTLMLGAIASGPAVTFVGPVAAALTAVQGGQSRWWVAKYLPEGPPASRKTPPSASPKQTAHPAAPHPPSVRATPMATVP
ncbi:MAG: hypothetical protein AB7W37_11335 [Syntrophobacteraceae bacterium]